jgi:hypothetical protein
VLPPMLVPPQSNGVACDFSARSEAEYAARLMKSAPRLPVRRLVAARDWCGRGGMWFWSISGPSESLRLRRLSRTWVLSSLNPSSEAERDRDRHRHRHRAALPSAKVGRSPNQSGGEGERGSGSAGMKGCTWNMGGASVGLSCVRRG